jgi:hypothetical protein
MPKRLVQSSVIYRDLHRQYPVIARGEGVYLWDAEGRRLCLTRAQADELVAMLDGAIGAVLARL